MRILQDIHGRSFSYLRLSLTDACNFRCRYCLPNGFERRPRSGNPLEDTILSIAEIKNLSCGFASLGFRKIRLTGGEPTLRPEIIEIVRKIAQVPAIKTIALTTNGYLLAKLAEPLRDAGLNAINISLDSLDPNRFEQITGSRNFETVRQGVLQALRVGIERVKINVVLLKSSIKQDLGAFLEWLRETPISVRFIELMQTRDNGEFFRAEHLSGDEFRASLEVQGWTEVSRGDSDGPARDFVHSGFAGRLGIIAPYSKDFCTDCNRLRISSRGKLKLCLFGDGEYSLRHLLQSPDQQEDLVQTVHALMGNKAQSHFLHEGIFGSTQHLAGIGG